MIWRQGVMVLGLLALLAGCRGTETAGEQEAATSAGAADAGDDSTSDDGSREIDGGGTSDLGGQPPDIGEFRNPRFGRGGSPR